MLLDNSIQRFLYDLKLLFYLHDKVQRFVNIAVVFIRRIVDRWIMDQWINALAPAPNRK